MEQFHDIVERILEKLPVKSLLRFKSVSIQWKSTIESPYFKKRHLIRRQSQDPDVLIFNPIENNHDPDLESDHNVTRMFTMASSELIKIPNLCPPPVTVHFYHRNYTISYRDDYYVSGSCDGMICYHDCCTSTYVVNPITRWSRRVPLSRYQEISLDMMNRDTWKRKGDEEWKLGFGKDKFTDTYKLVWLYNSFESGLENGMNCEVFDFSTNTWRYVTAAPIRILDRIPLYLDGSLHWFIDECITETRVLSFDLHTETFHIITSKPPFVQAIHKRIVMCNLNNQLCVSQKEWPRQEIWSLNNSDMTWEKIYSLDLHSDFDLFAIDNTYIFHQDINLCVIPIAVLKKKNSLVLLDTHAENPSLTIYDPELRSYDVCSPLDYIVYYQTVAVSFSPSLISIQLYE